MCQHLCGGRAKRRLERRCVLSGSQRDGCSGCTDLGEHEDGIFIEIGAFQDRDMIVLARSERIFHRLRQDDPVDVGGKRERKPVRVQGRSSDQRARREGTHARDGLRAAPKALSKGCSVRLAGN